MEAGYTVAGFLEQFPTVRRDQATAVLAAVGRDVPPGDADGRSPPSLPSRPDLPPLAIDYSGPREPTERRHPPSRYVAWAGVFLSVLAVVLCVFEPDLIRLTGWPEHSIALGGSATVLAIGVAYLWVRTFEDAAPPARRWRAVLSAALATAALLGVVRLTLSDGGFDYGLLRRRSESPEPAVVAVVAAVVFVIVNRGGKRPPPIR